MSNISISRYGWTCPLCDKHVERCKCHSADLRKTILEQRDEIKELKKELETIPS
jgi:transcription initiation factor IIE alpha subunit